MAGKLPNHAGSPISFAMLLNLASVVNAETPDILWGFIRRYSPDAIAGDRAVARPPGRSRHRLLPRLRPAGRSATASPTQPSARRWRISPRRWQRCRPDADAEAIQNAVYEVGKRHPFAELRDWFGCLYQVLLGQQEGPRFGGFVALYGIPETIALIRDALSRPAEAA